MSGHGRQVRGEHGMLSVKPRSYEIEEAKRWRKVESEAGRPSSLADFFSAHGICPKCTGEGVFFVGWSDPKNADEVRAAEGLNLKQLPVYDLCPMCRGTGKATNA